MESSNQNGYYGMEQAEDGNSEYNALLFMVSQVLANYSHAALVQVQAVTSAGELAPAGRVDVLPLVNQLDGQGNAVPHGVLNNMIYLRLQGGGNAIIMDPAIDDIGLALFADRDISTVVANVEKEDKREPANPGSMRRSDMADGIYLGGVLNAIPEQFIRFSDAGIEIVSPTAITMNAPAISMECETLSIAASESVAIESPDVSVDCTTMAVDASSSVTFTTPQFSVVGAASVSGLTSLNGGFAALPKAGGGASTIASDVSITGATTTTGTLSNNGKAVGSTHTHQAQGATAITTPPL
ncbi:MAG: oxidoreductase [Pseudomonadota bacterium]